ncbi:hypothetical protein FA13DRAFT_1396615 [Coprinellus micaceus]|uniref:Uncharacterized protein n=1 Tax=Coprinellus micaceus TaxID=71717 RepID=A0A4Y7SQG1_COPMI|nr:hypothetical protein FA13DRAFT_1396615 [Coprinellus micaceus]
MRRLRCLHREPMDNTCEPINTSRLDVHRLNTPPCSSLPLVFLPLEHPHRRPVIWARRLHPVIHIRQIREESIGTFEKVGGRVEPGAMIPTTH